MTLSTETAPGKTAPGKTAPITLQDNVWIGEFELDDYLQLLGGNTLAGWLRATILPGPED